MSVWARTIFAMLPQAMNPMTSVTSTGRGKLDGTIASSANDMIINGMATKMSVILLNS